MPSEKLQHANSRFKNKSRQFSTPQAPAMFKTERRAGNQVDMLAADSFRDVFLMSIDCD